MINVEKQKEKYVQYVVQYVVHRTHLERHLEVEYFSISGEDLPGSVHLHKGRLPVMRLLQENNLFVHLPSYLFNFQKNIQIVSFSQRIGKSSRSAEATFHRLKKGFFS